MIDQSTLVATTSILVIDDEDYVADMIASALVMEGYEARVAYNGFDGIVSAQQTHVDLIILDLMMPAMNGEAVVSQLRTMDATRTVPIILISAGARPKDALRSLGFVAKPFEIKRLLREVRAQLHA